MADAQSLVKDHAQQFEAYYSHLVEWNERMNLTGITEKYEVHFKHFVDSLFVTEVEEWSLAVRDGSTVADIGTGAGFPGLPLAICHPGVQFVLCDSLRKRLGFLEHVCREIGLQNVELVHGRAEDLARQPQYRGKFDAVVSRAVARLNVLEELTLPFLRSGGYLFAYKGPGITEELEDGKRAARLLGAGVTRVDEKVLPEDMGIRSIVVVRQEKFSSKAYPRKAGTPQKQPL